MIANARSLALAFVGLPAVVGFGTVPGGVEVNPEGTNNAFRPDLTYLIGASNPCALLEDAKEVNVLTTGWCGQITTKEECGDAEANETLRNLRLGPSKLTSDYGLATNYDICAWDKDFGTAGKCRMAEWTYTCPVAYCEGVVAKQRSDPTTTLNTDCGTNTIGSLLHFTPADPPYLHPDFGASLQYYRPASYYYLEVCEHKLIDTAGRRLETTKADKTPPPRRRLDFGDCPVSTTKHTMTDGAICCDNSAPGAAVVSLVDPFKETADGSFQIEYLETCKFEGGSTCSCSYERQQLPFTGCPQIDPTPWL